ncbi:MAG: hypothetical protein WAS07_09285 [Micropruina sp.]
MTSMIRPFTASLAALVALVGCSTGSSPDAALPTASATPSPTVTAAATSTVTLDGIVITQKGRATCVSEGAERTLTVTQAKNADYGKITADVRVATNKVSAVTISTSTGPIGKQTVTYKTGTKGLKAPTLTSSGAEVIVTGRGKWATKSDPKGSTVLDFVLRIDCPSA